MKIRWLGHAGFKISLQDPSDSAITRNVYIDTWLDGPTFPSDAKDEMNDADLILVTHGHFDHSASAPTLYSQSKANGKDPKLVGMAELMKHFCKHHSIPDDGISMMNKGTPIDFGFCTITQVSADHSSG